MMDYIELGTTPINEDCVSVSSEVQYLHAMKQECHRFMDMLEKRFPNIPNGCYYSIKKFPHDFGGYYDVVINYDDEIQEQEDYAMLVEGNLPEYWNDTDIITSKGGM